MSFNIHASMNYAQSQDKLWMAKKYVELRRKSGLDNPRKCASVCKFYMAFTLWQYGRVTGFRGMNSIVGSLDN